MALPAVHGKVQPDLAERRLRQVSAWLILYLLLQAELGLAWDRQWHDLVGRDQFWIPPHIMIYTGIGAAGLIALGLVLTDTFRYRRKAAGVDDTSTIGVLWLFHAPLGFILLGVGTLIDLLAAPFDNYWHELYGIDVTLWTPFHLMGVFGGVMAGLGIMYVFASEAVHERQVEYPSRRLLGLNGPEWGIVLLIAGFLELVPPALTAFIPLVLGPVQLLTYPLVLTFVASSCLISIYLCTRRPGITLLTVLILWPLSVVTEVYVLFALDFMVARLGLSYRVGREPVFNATLALLPLLFLVSALILEAVAYWQHHHGGQKDEDLRGAWLLGVVMAVPAVVVPPIIVHALASFIWLPPDVVHVLEPGWF